jgi:hypothetical protein
LATQKLEAAVSVFGAVAKAKLNNPAIAGAAQEQLRGPESLIKALAATAGLSADSLELVGETSLSDLKRGNRPPEPRP